MSYHKSLVLNKNWQLVLVDDDQLTSPMTKLTDFPEQTLAANVPGDWVLDYVEAGLLEDPFYQDNYLKLMLYETSHVFYGTRFVWDGTCQETYLRFEGIDTVADVYLNGQWIGHAENMYICHEFPTKGLVQGENQVVVHIKPAVLEARKHPLDTFSRALQYNYESLAIRKAAHMFGWDICPRIVSAGLWRPVTLVQKKPIRINDLFLWVDALDAGCAKCLAAFDVELGNHPATNYSLRLEGCCGDSSFALEQKLWFSRGRLKFDIPEAKLWWPAGYGEANLYDITLTLLQKGTEVDNCAWRQGLRTAELARDDMLDEDGNGDFCFVINQKRIYVKGTNWVPADAFHSRDAQRIAQILPLVKDVGCNAMRIWGGGVYENDSFYDWCDENGILIWQDFMMACGVYPHTERMKKQLEEEAISIVKRLRHHSCICLWAGDNECDQFYCWDETPHDPTGNVLTRGILPAVLQREDLTRPYLPSSPYVSHYAYVKGMVQNTPEQHLWGPRDYFKSRFYHDATAVFASEMGYHGCNSPKSLYRFLGREHAWPVKDNPMYLYHAASPETSPYAPYTYRIPLMTNQLMLLFGQEPRNVEEFARMSQISQAEAKKYFVESFRSRMGKRTGLIWWNLMDCWPQVSDAVVDYYFCKKLAYFFIRRSQKPLCLMMDDHSGELTLYGVSDLNEDTPVSYTVTDLDADTVLLSGKVLIRTESSTKISTIPNLQSPAFLSIRWKTAAGQEGSNHYLYGKPPYSYDWYCKHLHTMQYDTFEGFEP